MHIVHLDFGGQNSGLLRAIITKERMLPIMTKMKHAARVIVLIVMKSILMVTIMIIIIPRSITFSVTEKGPAVYHSA